MVEEGNELMKERRQKKKKERKEKRGNFLKICVKWAEEYFWKAIFFSIHSSQIIHKNTQKKVMLRNTHKKEN